MPIIIILSVIFIILLIVAIFCDSYDLGGGCVAVDLFLGFILAIMIYCALTKNVRAETFKSVYESTKEVVETYHPYDYGNTQDITSKIFQINNTIARHKARSKHPWFKIWYSEEVGNLEPISFKKTNKNE